MPLNDVLLAAHGALEQDVSLLVAYQNPDGFEARSVTLGETAAAGLRDLSREWLATLENYVDVPYEATAELADGQVFLIEDPNTVAELAPLYDLANQAVELPPLAVDDLDHRISMYALVAGNEERIALFRRSDPRIGYTGGRRWLAVFGERLEQLDTPAFAFYSSLDFVLASDWALVVNQIAFERLFRDAGLVEQHIAEWVQGLEQHLPWADGSVEALQEVAIRDSRVWRRLREIHRRGHLADVEIGEIRDYAEEMDLDIENVVVDERLVFRPEDRFTILHLLNEDLFRGPLTDERFEAQRKTGA